MHYLNELRMAAGLVIKPELEKTVKTPAVEPVVETKVEEIELVWESVNLQFGVDGNGPFNVVSNKGDIHDTYETEKEAQAVAKTLNKKHGGGELKEAKDPDDVDDDEATVDANLKSVKDGKVADKDAIEKAMKEKKTAPDVENDIRRRLGEGKKADKDYDKDGEVESSEEEHKGVVDKKIKAKKGEEDEECMKEETETTKPVAEAAGTTLGLITDKDENPKPNKDEQSIAKGEEKVKCPANLLKMLKTEMAEAEKESEYHKDRDQETAKFYNNLAIAMETLHKHLSEGTHESMQRAQIEFSSWMNIMQHKVPSQVVDFIMKGGKITSLKDFYKEVKMKK